jgi:flagellar basal-body rod protein FlgC
MTRIITIFILLITTNAFALKDDLHQAIEMGVHGTSFQANRITVAAENLANESSTGSTPGANPYARKLIFAKNKFNRRLGTNVVTVKKYSLDKKDFPLRYSPRHPAADANGYVKMPNVNRDIERADAAEAQRTYEANLGIIETSRSLIKTTLEAIK